MAIDLRGKLSVLFYDTFSAFPATGSTTILYVDRGDMVVYIWNGSSYDQLNNGSNITTVANYSALLAIGASNVPNMFYWCSSAQGTSWLPGPLGGTYYNSGLYYSNGTSWEYMNSPYQATQAEVNTGIVADKFVTPSTFYNSSKWASIPITIGITPITSGVVGRVLFEGAGNVVQEDSGLFWDNTNKRLNLGGDLSLATNKKIYASNSNAYYINIASGSNTTDIAGFSGIKLFTGSGSEAMRISSVNNVGIGTTSPQAKLDVRAQGALSTDIVFRVRNSADTSNLFMVKGNGVLNAANLPTSATGLVAGDIWNNSGVLNIV